MARPVGKNEQLLYIAQKSTSPYGQQYPNLCSPTGERIQGSANIESNRLTDYCNLNISYTWKEGDSQKCRRLQRAVSIFIVLHNQ